MSRTQATFGEFAQDFEESAESDPFDFDDYGPTMDRPLPVEEQKRKVWKERLRSRGFSPDVLQEESYHGGLPEFHIDDREKPSELDHFEETMSDINPDHGDDTQTDEHTDDSDRLSDLLEVIHRRETGTYTPGQGTALDRVRTIQRKIEHRPIDEWTTNYIEAQLYDLSHLFGALRVPGDNPGQNCKRLSTAAEALHQDLIAELQGRDHWDRDTRQYLTNQFGSACSLVEYANTPCYCASNHLEEMQNLTGVDDRIADLFEESDEEDDSAESGESDDAPEAVADGGQVDGYVCEMCDEETPADRRLADDTMVCSDHYDQVTADEPKAEAEAGDEVLIIEQPAVGRMCSPSIISGEVSSTGKSVMIPEDEGLRNKTRRLDASEIFDGNSEYRDSTGYELYTPGRYRSNQRANQAPGPQAGANEISDIGSLPEPTHWPDTDAPDDAPEQCPACGEPGGRWQDVGKPRCERCGELYDPESTDDGHDKWDLDQYDRGDVLALDKYSGRFVIVGMKKTQFGDVLALDVVDSDDQVYRLQKVDAGGQFFDVRPGEYEGGQFREQGGSAPIRMVEEMDDVQDFEKVDEDEQRLRRWIREHRHR